MKNEIILFSSNNGNRYFYDPQLKEIFIFQEKFYQEQTTFCSNKIKQKNSFPLLTGKDVEYQLANIKQVTFEMTEKCNLNCYYCTYGNLYSTVNRMGADIQFSFIQNILVFLNEKMNSLLNASESNPFYISFYGGEPLLCFELIKKTVDLVNKLTFSNNTVVFSMTTNAFYLDKYMDYLKDHKFKLLISMDGNEEGNGLRVDHNGKSQFDKVFRNVKSLKDKYPDYFKTHVNFNSVLSKRNSVESITNFIETHFEKIPTIAAINPLGLNPTKIEDFINVYTSSSESFIEAEKVMDVKDKYFIRHPEIKDVFLFLRSVCNNSFVDYNSFLIKENKKQLLTGTCLPFQKRMFVSSNGLILPCENVSHENALGYVNEHGINLDTEKIAEMYNKAFQELEEQCKSCFGHDTCSQCIFQMKTRFKCSEKVSKKNLQERFSRAITFIENNPELYVRMMEDICVE